MKNPQKYQNFEANSEPPKPNRIKSTPHSLSIQFRSAQKSKKSTELTDPQDSSR